MSINICHRIKGPASRGLLPPAAFTSPGRAPPGRQRSSAPRTAPASGPSSDSRWDVRSGPAPPPPAPRSTAHSTGPPSHAAIAEQRTEDEKARPPWRGTRTAHCSANRPTDQAAPRHPCGLLGPERNLATGSLARTKTCGLERHHRRRRVNTPARTIDSATSHRIPHHFLLGVALDFLGLPSRC